MLDVNFWQERYDSANTPWDLGAASPHFVALLEEKLYPLPPGRVAVPGSGRGHDAALFARAGFDVTGFDYAPGAIEESSKLYGDLLRFEQADITDAAFAAESSPWHHTFDYVLEHTCFCAIHPKLRKDYARVAADLLKPGGLLVGVFWEHGDPDGPPYPTTPAEVAGILGSNFEQVAAIPRPPASGRSGTEHLLVFRRKALG